MSLRIKTFKNKMLPRPKALLESEIADELKGVRSKRQYCSFILLERTRIYTSVAKTA